MNKAELVAEIATKSKLTKKDSELALNTFIDVIGEALKSNKKVKLVGFGTFEARGRKARVGVNPQTQEKIEIPQISWRKNS